MLNFLILIWYDNKKFMIHNSIPEVIYMKTSNKNVISLEKILWNNFKLNLSNLNKLKMYENIKMYLNL